MGQKRAVRSPLSSALCCKTLHLLRPPCPCMFCSCRQSREVRFECPVNKSMASITGKRQCEWNHSCEWTCRIRNAALPCVLPTRPAAATSPPQGAVARGPNADEDVPAESWGPEACVGHCGTGSSPAAGVALPFAPAMGSLLSGAQAPFSAELPALLQAHSAEQSWRPSVHLQELVVHPLSLFIFPG